MFIKQLFTKCLSESAYYIESEGEAAIIDPLRDIDEYLALAKERNAVIKYIFETHFHADFVSGHLDLSQQTGAPIIYGPQAVAQYKIYNSTDGEIFKLGKISFKVIHTPGHTIESTCYLLQDENEKPHAIFTGDALFVGDVGRPDLSSGGLSSEALASIMYDTIKNKILPLPNNVIVYPAHGAGSSCGKNIGPNIFSTIEQEKQTNYALQPQTKENFIKLITADIPPAPKYFSVNAQINMQGYPNFEKVKQNGITPLSIKDFKKLMDNDAIILDTRPSNIFTQGFVPGSIFIGLEGRFAEWAGSLLPFDKPIILVTESGKEEETVTRLSRVGFDKMSGFLQGGFEAWQTAGEEIDLIIDIAADELAMDITFDEKVVVVDVRRETEFAESHIKGAQNIPLIEMADVVNIANFEDDQNLYVHCSGGYRSVIACALLKKQGLHNLRNILGGWDKIKDEKKISIEKEASILN